MYRLKVKDSIFTIPKKNIILLAMTKMFDLKKKVDLTTEEKAVAFLESIGIEVELVKENV